MFLEPVHLEAALAKPGAAEVADRLLAGATRNQIGIDGIDRHEALQQFDWIVAHCRLHDLLRCAADDPGIDRRIGRAFAVENQNARVRAQRRDACARVDRLGRQ